MTRVSCLSIQLAYLDLAFRLLQPAGLNRPKSLPKRNSLQPKSFSSPTANFYYPTISYSTVAAFLRDVSSSRECFRL